MILDDEQPSIDKLEKLLKESQLVEIKAKFTEPLTALEFLKTNPIDLAFLDIEMPNMDGIDFSNLALGLQKRMAIVFVTAYNQYAVEAFRLNALDYLLKPVTADRLKETLSRIIEEQEFQTTQTGTVKIVCFGKFKVACAGSEVKFRTKKAEDLLALLIDRRGAFVHRNEICDFLWEEYDGDRAVIHFNTTLHYMKKALLQWGVGAQIEHDKGSYRLKTEELDCDYLRFQGFTRAADAVNHSDISAYEEAARLYQGDYLAGMDYPWVERSRRMLKERFITLLLLISGCYQAAGDLQKAITWLKQGLVHEPLHREINFQLIAALLLANDRVAADQYYQIYGSELRRKFQQKPDDGFANLLK